MQQILYGIAQTRLVRYERFDRIRKSLRVAVKGKMRRYTHLLRGQKQKAINKMPRFGKDKKREKTA